MLQLFQGKCRKLFLDFRILNLALCLLIKGPAVFLDFDGKLKDFAGIKTVNNECGLLLNSIRVNPLSSEFMPCNCFFMDFHL